MYSEIPSEHILYEAKDLFHSGGKDNSHLCFKHKEIRYAITHGDNDTYIYTNSDDINITENDSRYKGSASKIVKAINQNPTLHLNRYQTKLRRHGKFINQEKLNLISALT